MPRNSFILSMVALVMLIAAGCSPPQQVAQSPPPLGSEPQPHGQELPPVTRTQSPRFEEIVAAANQRHPITASPPTEQPDSSPAPPPVVKPRPARPDYAAQLKQALDIAAREQETREWQHRLRIQAELARDAPPLGRPQEAPNFPEVERSMPTSMITAPITLRPPSTTGRPRRTRAPEAAEPERPRTLWSTAGATPGRQQRRPFGVCPPTPVSLTEAAFSDPLERSCADGIDNDGNGVSDREDPHCWLDWQSPSTYSTALYESGPILLRGSVAPLSPAIPFTTPSRPAWQMPSRPRRR